jgi:hypothetical protein
VALPLTVAVASRPTPLKFEQINAEARQRISRQAVAVHTFRDERTRWESTAASPKTQPSPSRKPAVIPPIERQETIPPPKERKAAVTPPIERAQPYRNGLFSPR